MMIDAATDTAPRRQHGEQDCLARRPEPRSSLRRTIPIAVLVIFGASFRSASCPAQNSTEKQAAALSRLGVSVERVKQGEEAEAASIQVGDQIVEWARDGSSGTIRSPFDWAEMLTEEAPRGTITLVGRRRNQKMVWSLGLRSWGLTVEPFFPERLIKTYDSCSSLLTAEKYKEASLCWESLASKSRPDDPQWLERFISNRLAESFSKQQRWTEADQTYQRAVERAKAFDQKSVAETLEVWSLAKRDQGDLRAAIQYCEEALKIRQTLDADSLAVAKTLNDCGDIDRERDGVEKAEQDYFKALAIRQELAAGSMAEAASLGSIGNLSWVRGDLAKADEFHRRALVIQEKLAPGSLSVASSLVPLGLVAWRRGNLAEAEKYLLEAHDIYEKRSPGSYNVSATVNNLGLVALSRGDLAKAEESFRQALAVQEKLAPGSLDVASKLSNLAFVAERRGDLALAENYEARALAIRQKLGARLGVATSLGVLGQVALDRGDHAKADSSFRGALAIQEELAPDSEFVAGTLHSLGSVAKDLGDLAKAEQYYLRALGIQEKLAPGGEMVAGTLDELGALARTNGNLGKAEEYLVRSLVIEERLAPGSQDHANVLHDLGLLMRAEGNMEKAEHYMAASVGALEHQAALLGGGRSAQAEFGAQQAYYYKDYLETLLELGQADRAFVTVERSRARLLLAMLAERDLVIDADLPAEILRARKANASAYDETEEELSKLSPVKDSVRIDQLSSRLRELNTEREQLIDSVRKASPRFGDLRYPKPLGANEVREILDPGTTLASFSICQDRTVLFVVQPAGVEPGLSVFTLPIGEKALRTQVLEFRKLILERRTGKDSLLTVRARELYDELLRPAEAILSKGDRLVVVPDGPLHLLPFQALMRDSGDYLLEWKPLSTVVSATVFAELKRARREQVKPVELVAFGDPRIPRQGKGPSESIVDVEVRSSVERGLSLGRLPFSRIEVENVSALYPNRSQKYLGDQATEERAKSIGKDVRYVHFAVHGLLDERLPLNSALVLSIPDKPATGKDNGLLQAWEIFDQMRLDADLVTLSACNSGLGEELSGEGLLGLTRAFQYAGARSILASFWSVDDLRTMELMTEFYGELRADSSKEKALQLAQLKLLHSRSASAPYYWAGFMLVGDWR